MSGCTFTCSGYAEHFEKKIAEYTITTESSEESQIDAYIRYYFHENPDNMTDDEYWKAWGQLKFVLKQTGQYKD